MQNFFAEENGILYARESDLIECFPGEGERSPASRCPLLA